MAKKERGFLTDKYTGQSFPITIHHTEASLKVRFDQAVDDATHAVIAEFEWMGLPEGDQLSGLMVEINNAITAIMQEWK